MNPISIDIQRWFSYSILAETNQQYLSYSIVGDGYRNFIPHAFQGELWGTAALGPNQDLPIGPAPFYDLYSQPEQAALFFKGYYRRLTAFLGMTEPLKQNGYEPVMVVHSDRFSEDWLAFRQVMRREQCFPEVDIIPSDLALLCRWLASATVTESTYILPVVIGDGLVTMALYHLQKQSQQTLTPVFKGQASFPTGYMIWVEQFTAILSQRLGGKTIEPTLSLHDNLLDFLFRVQAAPDVKHTWSGPFKQELRMRNSLPDNSIFDSPLFSFEVLLDWLGSTANRLLSEAGFGAPALMIMGGKGAVFPFDRQKDSLPFPVENIQLSAESIALGGLLWPCCSQDVSRAFKTNTNNPCCQPKSISIRRKTRSIQVLADKISLKRIIP